MPNRVLRDWTTSETIDLLTPGAEVFFTRLIMKADDFGNYTANPKLLKAALFPLKPFSQVEVRAWLNECVNLKIIERYSVDGKDYINIPNFNQRLRAMRSQYPDKSQSNDGHMSDIGRPETKRNEVETETESEGATAQVIVWPSFDDFWELYAKKVDRPKCEKKWKKIPQGAREKIMSHVEAYVFSTPDVQYRKNPATYLNNESWNNEIVKNGNAAKQITRDDRVKYIESKYGTARTPQE